MLLTFFQYKPYNAQIKIDYWLKSKELYKKGKLVHEKPKHEQKTQFSPQKLGKTE